MANLTRSIPITVLTPASDAVRNVTPASTSSAETPRREDTEASRGSTSDYGSNWPGSRKPPGMHERSANANGEGSLPDSSDYDDNKQTSKKNQAEIDAI